MHNSDFLSAQLSILAPDMDEDQGGPALQGIPIVPDIINLIIQMQQNGQMDAKPQEMVTRGSWTQVEDDLLMGAVQQFGPKKWTEVAKMVPTRTSKQCRERWFNRLSPELKHDPFEPWEDEIILQRQKEIGNRWSLIARQLPGRSPNAIKNRWYSGLKGQHEPLAQIIGGELMLPMPDQDGAPGPNDL